jgi:thiamine biosynthesis lipoprotein
MGTVFSIDVRSPGVGEEALDAVVRWLHRVDSVFSTYRPDSEISRLARAELTRTACSPEVQSVLARCDELHESTGGFFSAYASGCLDPSGYVKGWAIERASDILVAAGSPNHSVNGGGDIQCAGEAAPHRPWRIGIANPLRPGELVSTVAGAGLAIATSGVAERGTHIVDPHTGQAPHGLSSVTVVGTRLALADAYATAAFAMGGAAQHWLEGLQGHCGFGVTADGQTWATTRWAEVHGGCAVGTGDGSGPIAAEGVVRGDQVAGQHGLRR